MNLRLIVSVIFMMNSLSAATQQPRYIATDTLLYAKKRFNPDSSVVSFHKATIRKKQVSYKVTTGTQPLYDRKGEIIAGIFSVYYERTGMKSSNRPLVFFFNGGYGSPAKWLHLGYAGPRIANVDNNGFPLQPYGVVENPYSILDVADLVFVDPIGTGYSHPYGVFQEGDKRFFNEKADVTYLRDFICDFLDKYNRRVSPVLLVGESNGGRRVARLSGYFNTISKHSYINLTGTVLVSSAKLHGNFGDREVPFLFKMASWFPLYAKYAYESGILSKENPKKNKSQCEAEAKEFALKNLVPSLMKIGFLSDSLKMALAKKIAEFTGIEIKQVIEKNLMIDTVFFNSQMRKVNQSTNFSVCEPEFRKYYVTWLRFSGLVTEFFTQRYYLNSQIDPDIDSMLLLSDSVENFLIKTYLPVLLKNAANGKQIPDQSIQSQIIKLMGELPIDDESDRRPLEKISDKRLANLGWSQLDIYDTRYNGKSGFKDPRRQAIDPALLYYLNTELKYRPGIRYDEPDYHWNSEGINFGSDPITSLERAMKSSPYMKVMVQAGLYDRATNYQSQKFNIWQLNPDGGLKNRISMKSYRAGHMFYFRKSERIRACEDLRSFILSCIPQKRYNNRLQIF